jgi:hypothetical protein
VRARSRVISARPLVAAILLAAPLGAQQTGQVAGTVRIASGVVSNARAILDAAREVRSDSGGRFRFDQVSAGRHHLEVLAIGMTPYRVDVIVNANDTLTFDVLVEKIVILDSMLVEGNTVRQGFVRDYMDRKRVGLGKYMDSVEVKRFGEIRQALLFIPGVRCQKKCEDVLFSTGTGFCLPNVWIDKENWGTDQGVLKTMRPDDVMAVEVYSRSGMVPEEFQPRGREKGCGALVVWTRRFWPQGKGKPR